MFSSLRRLVSVIIVLSVCPAVANVASAQPAAPKFAYPSASRTQSGDYYHNTWVADPYRWLEQHDAADTKNWLSAQQDFTRKYLDSIGRHKEIASKAKETLDFERRSVPVKVAGKFFYLKNSGL